MKSERYFVYDCNGIRIGNPKGYKVFWSANRSQNGALQKRIQNAFDARSDKNNNLISSIKLETVA